MTKEAKILLLMSALFTFAAGLSGIFVNIFFWKQTNSFIIIVIYNMLHYITTPMTFILGGIIAKKKNGIWSLRIGLILYAFFYSLMLFLGNRGGIYIYILGVIYGCAVGFYWLAFNTLSFDFTCVTNRDTFNGFNGSCAGVAAAIAPITSGYIITRYAGTKGYSIVFTITLSIFLILFFISLILKCNNYGSKVDFSRAFSKNCSDWSIIRKASALWGFRDVIIGVLVNILIIQTTGSELSLGKLTFIGALVSSASYVLVQKVIKPPKRRLAIYIGTIGSFLAVVIISLKVSFNTLFIFMIMDSFFLPFFLIQLSSSTFNVINKIHEEDLRIEYMINKDIMLNAGRVISSIILLLLLSLFKGAFVIKGYLLLIGVVPVVAGYFLRRLSKVLDGDDLPKCNKASSKNK
ncbi:YQGE family putative transporter [Clostridium punense]|uniref:YQGE family putative transporter n=2 Tax=Clostridium TaxID=1485 RepID=A0ABS4K0L6_9CLOT|nr:MFS transporter [Clostridium punense]MBP2021313.1 YQGE family putative transporter [Clostridium punense]